MPYCVEPTRLLLRFKREDEDLLSTLRRAARRGGLSVNETAQLLMRFALDDLRNPEEASKAKKVLPRRLMQ